jgi:hypothetical protein
MALMLRAMVLAVGSIFRSRLLIAALVIGLHSPVNAPGDELHNVLQPTGRSAAKPTVVAKIGATKGWATFGLALPKGVAREGLQVGGMKSQPDVKTRWSDGSIRFAVLTAWIPRSGTYQVSTCPEGVGTFQPEAPQAAVRLTIADRQWTAQLPGKPSKDIWLAGPLLSEWRAGVSPLDSEGHSHPFLRVLLDTRCYSDGKSRVDVTVENNLDVQTATAVTYDVEIRIGERTVFRKGKVTHPYLTRWRKVIAADAQISDVTPDFEPFFRAKALPRYLALAANRVAKPEGPDFDILQKGHLHPDMRDHGGRPELAPYPDWTARYIADRDPTQGRYVRAHGDLAGSWPVHIQEAEDGKYKGLGRGRLVSIDERPNFWLDSRADPDGRPRGDLTALGPLAPDNAHVPSLAYVPYLITGDRYYADEMSYWANYVLLRTFQDTYYKARGGSQGLLESNETRGIAWGLRNMVDAAAYLPDDDPVKAYLTEKVVNNLKWADNYAEKHVTPLGSYFEWPGPDRGNTKTWTIRAPWQNNYVAWSLDHAGQQGFQGGEKLRDRMVKFQLALFTSPDYDRSYAAPYVLIIGNRLDDQRIEYFKTLRQAFEVTFGNPPEKPTPFVGYYGVDARLMLIIACRKHWRGAMDAYTYLNKRLTTSPAPNGVADLAVRAGWALALDQE